MRAGVNIIQDRQATPPRGEAVAPSCPSPPAGRRTLTPQKEKAGSTGPSLFDDRFGLTPSLPCKAEKGSAQFWKLYGGAFVALRRSQVVLNADLASLAKVHPDHFAQLCLSKSARPVRPAAVIHQ